MKQKDFENYEGFSLQKLLVCSVSNLSLLCNVDILENNIWSLSVFLFQNQMQEFGKEHR